MLIKSNVHNGTQSVSHRALVCASRRGLSHETDCLVLGWVGVWMNVVDGKCGGDIESQVTAPTHTLIIS